MGTYLAVTWLGLGVQLAFGAIMMGCAFAGFRGETPMVVGAVAALVLWGTFAGLVGRAMVLLRAAGPTAPEALEASFQWAMALSWVFLFLAAGTGLLLAFGAFASCGPTWLSGLFHWGGLAASVLALAFRLGLPPAAQRAFSELGRTVPESSVWAPWIAGGAVYLLWGGAWLVAWLLLRGGVDASTYPPRASSPYRLPFPAGESAWVIQGNNSSLNHNGGERYAWDFRRRCGTPVLAARDGQVSQVVDTNRGNGGGASNNEIEVTHTDGTVGRYLHIQQGSAAVAVGNSVRRGQQLARVGNVGNSLTGHIHFVVERGGTSIPVTFEDVAEDAGIPRTFSSVTSGNR